MLTLTADFLLSKMVICSIIYKLTLEFFTNPNLAKLPILKLQNLLVGTIGIAIQICLHELQLSESGVYGTPSREHAPPPFLYSCFMHVRKRKEDLLMSVHLVNSLPLLQSWCVRAGSNMGNSSHSMSHLDFLMLLHKLSLSSK